MYTFRHPYVIQYVCVDVCLCLPVCVCMCVYVWLFAYIFVRVSAAVEVVECCWFMRRAYVSRLHLWFMDAAADKDGLDPSTVDAG